MLKSDSTYYNSSSSSTESECFSENSKSIDTVTQLFSNLLKTSESTPNLRCKSPSTSPPNETFSQSQDCYRTSDKNDKIDLNCVIENLEKSIIVKEACDKSEPLETNSSISKLEEINLGVKSSILAASSETVILEKNKEYCTPFNSKIPVLYVKSDPLDFYNTDKKTPPARRKLNPGSLKRICSNSKIPIRSTKKDYFESNYQNKCSSMDYSKIRVNRQEHTQTTGKRMDKNSNNKYNHVKSKLAAYIHRPSKVDSKFVYSSSNARSSSKSSFDCKKVKNDYNLNSSNYLNLKRMNSRTSLDTYTCEFKTVLPDFNCLDDDSSKNFQKAREHFELAAEHCKLKLENQRIVEEHSRIIAKHQRLILEHEEKANEHELKAIACILNRVT